MALLSWLTPEDLSGEIQHANDVWAYVSPAGREYAIVGLERGTAFVDVTDPVDPRVVKVVRGPESVWRDIAVFDEFAYVVNETGGGIQVLDLRRIDRGRVRKRRSVQQDGLRTAHNISINPDSGYAYLSGSNLADGGLVAVDLANPLRPVLEPVTWPFVYVHDMLVVTFKKRLRAGREIAFAFAGEDGLQILDVTDKGNIFKVSEVRYPGLTYCHSGWLHKKLRFLFVNDELDERSNPDVETTTTYILRIQNLELPRFSRAWSNGSTAIDHNSMVRRNFLFQSNYSSGLRVINVKRPRFPREVAFFDTRPEDDQPIFAGAWGVHAALPSGTVLITDIQLGLFALFFPN